MNVMFLVGQVPSVVRFFKKHKEITRAVFDVVKDFKIEREELSDFTKKLMFYIAKRSKNPHDDVAVALAYQILEDKDFLKEVQSKLKKKTKE